MKEVFSNFTFPIKLNPPSVLNIPTHVKVFADENLIGDAVVKSFKIKDGSLFIEMEMSNTKKENIIERIIRFLRGIVWKKR